MANIYYKVTIEKNWPSQTSSLGRAPTHADINEF